MMMSTYFQTVGNIVSSTLLGPSRYVLLSCPPMLLMGSVMAIDGMWWALVVADTLTGILCLGAAALESDRLFELEIGA